MSNVAMKILEQCVEMIKECIFLQVELAVAVFDHEDQDYIRTSFVPDYVECKNGKLIVEGSSVNAFSLPLNEIGEVEYDDFEDSYVLIRAGKTYDLARLD